MEKNIYVNFGVHGPLNMLRSAYLFMCNRMQIKSITERISDTGISRIIHIVTEGV